MTSGENDIKLYLPESISRDISSFKKGMLEKELQEINKAYPMNKGDVNIRLSYAAENDEGLEVQFFIRNNTERKVNFETLPISLVNKDKVIGRKMVNLKDIGTMPPFSAVPVIIQYNKDEIYHNEFEDLNIIFDMNGNWSTFFTKDVKIENIPENLDYKYRKLIEEYTNNLPRLKKDTVDFNTYSVSYDEQGNLNVVILVRNGYDRDIQIHTVPLSIYNADDIMVYNGTYNFMDMIIEKNSAKIFTISIDEQNVPIKDADFSKFRVDFR